MTGGRSLARDSLQQEAGATVMSASFLEEQLRRIREMTERMTRAANHAAELNDEIARTRAASARGPLDEVRDFRTYSSVFGSTVENESKDQSDADAGTPRRHTARESSRRRR
jgi:hypothetical protein